MQRCFVSVKKFRKGKGGGGEVHVCTCTVHKSMYLLYLGYMYIHVQPSFLGRRKRGRTTFSQNTQTIKNVAKRRFCPLLYESMLIKTRPALMTFEMTISTSCCEQLEIFSGLGETHPSTSIMDSLYRLEEEEEKEQAEEEEKKNRVGMRKRQN